MLRTFRSGSIQESKALFLELNKTILILLARFTVLENEPIYVR